MTDAQLQTVAAAGSRPEGELLAELTAARAEIERLTLEADDLRILYEATIEHGEAVEDQLAENNILLQRTQARLEAELADASRYILSILPERREQSPNTEWLLIPSTELGGDSFGYHEIDDDHFAIYLLDVCGHGVGAALLSVTVINVLRASALPHADFRQPSAVLTALNDAFPMERQNDMFFTIWYGVYRRSTGELAYAAGGHPPALRLRNGQDGKTQIDLLAGMDGLAIGAFPNMDYGSETVRIEPGDRLLVLSDGTYEVDDGADLMLGFDGLVDFVGGYGNDRPSAVLERVRSFHGEGALPDDFSLLRIEF
jgi:phosphoserine phosphatase RsbU/P